MEVIHEFLVRARAGDAAAARELDERLRPPLVRYAFRIVGDTGSAEDVVQEVLLKALSTEDTPAMLRPWLYRATRNLALNRRRDRARRGDTPLGPGTPLADSHTGHLTKLVRAEERAAVAELLAMMPEAEREVLDLRYGEGLGREEIAAVLGLEVSVVKSRLYEGLQRLRTRAARSGLGPSAEPGPGSDQPPR